LHVDGEAVCRPEKSLQPSNSVAGSDLRNPKLSFNPGVVMSNENLIPRNLQQAAVRHAVGAAVLLSCSVATYAQSAAAASASAASSVEKNDASGDTLTTVVISAMRRREPAREVPLQVDVVSSKELQDAGAKTLVDYMSNEPGVNVKTNGGSGGDSVTIRGVSAGDEVAPLVGVYVDDVAVGSSSAWVAGSRNGFDMSLLDLNHIEVLKGPRARCTARARWAGC
jgi:iron complex outermembrane receptor protein